MHTAYEHEKFLGYIVDKDIYLTGQEDDDSQKDEISTLFDETFSNSDKIANDGMLEFSMYLNPLFEEKVIEDSSEFTTFSNPLYEEDFVCSQIHQHHDEDIKSDSEIDETHEYSKDETSFNSSYEQEVHQTCEGEVESACIMGRICWRRVLKIFQVSYLMELLMRER